MHAHPFQFAARVRGVARGEMHFAVALFPLARGNFNLPTGAAKSGNLKLLGVFQIASLRPAEKQFARNLPQIAFARFHLASNLRQIGPGDSIMHTYLVRAIVGRRITDGRWGGMGV